MGDGEGSTCEQGQGWTAQQENCTTPGTLARHRPKIKSKNLKTCFRFSLRTCFVSFFRSTFFFQSCLLLDFESYLGSTVNSVLKVTGSRCWQDLLSGQWSCSGWGNVGAVSSYVVEMPGVGFGSGLGAEHLTLYPRWYQSVKKMV